ncbi:MAG TPA: amidohydrolase [Thermoanaerobaculia bacterium]|jgi:amidohydrolase|nr:amidohydrolase [Thermoanaerobaculia bacterium]
MARPWTWTVLLSLLLPATPGMAAEDLSARIDQAAQSTAPEIVEVRHRIHQNPELSNRESETAALVADYLKKIGLEPRTGVAKTGVVAVLKGGKPGPVIAVRADMDALPVAEQTDLPFKSTKRDTFLGQEVGVAHACGHDIHTSVQLGVAAVLKSIQKDLPGTVIFVFQPAEEGPPPGEEAGAPLMLKEGLFGDLKPKAIFALHSFPDLQVGQVGYNPGPTMAAVDQFVIKIKGKQAHGAYPHLSVDPIVIASQVVMALQTIRSRNLPAMEPSVVTVGIFRGGERFNIIPGEVHLEGTVRTYKEEVRSEVERRMREILDGITKAGGGSFEMEYRRNAPATVNDAALSRTSAALLERSLGAGNVKVVEPSMAGEDFAYFANEIPGFYFRLGVVAPGTSSGGLHTPTFRGDDSSVAVGIKAMSRLLVDYLREGPK